MSTKIQSIETRFENLSFFRPNDDGKGAIDKERLKTLEERFKEFKEKFSKTSDELVDDMRDLKDAMFLKSDKSDVQALERKVLEKLN